MKTYTSYPVNDHKIFFRHGSSFPFERTAIIIEHNDDNDADNEFNTLFVNDDAQVEQGYDKYWDYASVYERYYEIGTKGDTIVPADFAFGLSQDDADIEDVFDNIEKYFTIDKSKAEDVVKIRLDILHSNDFRMDVHSKWFAFGQYPLFFNLDNPNYKNEERNYNLYDILVYPLAFYSKYLGRDIKLDIDFCSWDNPFSSDARLESINKEIQAIREKYLPQIRQYIAEKYKIALEELDTTYKEQNPNASNWTNFNMDGIILELGK